MTNYFIYALALALLFSCGQTNQQQKSKIKTTSDSLAVVNDPKNYLNVQTRSFTEIDSTGILLFPLTMGETEREKGSLSYKEIRNNSNWNIIFYNSNLKEYHLLSERKMIIENYHLANSVVDNENTYQTTNYIFYTVITDDFNKDRVLTDQDPQYLFISDKNGHNFRQVSPSNYNLIDWKYLKSSKKLIMIVVKDSNKNKNFDESDEITTFEIDLDKEIEAREIFSNDFKNKLKILFDRDWKRLNN